jgi:hypothetical protein
MSNYEQAKYRVGYAEKHSVDEIIEYCWDDYIKGIDSDTLMIFVVLDEGQGGEHNLYHDKLAEQHNILKRYDLTLQNLENMNWTVTYP